VTGGILQINNYWHSSVTDQCAYDPACSFKSAYSITKGGTDFSQWTTFTSGAYSKFTNTVQSALGSNNTTTTPPATGNPCPDAHCAPLDFACHMGEALCTILTSQFFERSMFVLVGLLVAVVALVMIALGELGKGSK
jgi:hypothetical protein